MPPRLFLSPIYTQIVRRLPVKGNTVRYFQLKSASTEHDSGMGSMTGISKRVYVLGLGNIGCFIAHSLRSLPQPPPVTLLLHSQGLYEGWKAHKERITVHKSGFAEHRSGFDIDVLRDGFWHAIPQRSANSRGQLGERSTTMTDANSEPIDHLVLAVKAVQVENALKSVQHRLAPQSTILFLQNGMGIIDEVNQKIFPVPKSRPNYITGITSHGLTRINHFEVLHAGVGTTKLGIVSTNIGTIPKAEKNAVSDSRQSSYVDDHSAVSSRYLLRLLTGCPPLTAAAFKKADIVQFQLEKLAMNAVVNPLTVLFDCLNGDLLHNYNVSRLFRLLFIELSAVICAMPELQAVPGIRARFGPERLRTLATGLCRATAENTSSMLQDARGHKETEIQYINGYIYRRGEELGIRCVANYMLVQLVLAKTRAVSQKLSEEIPLDLSGELKL